MLKRTCTAFIMGFSRSCAHHRGALGTFSTSSSLLLSSNPTMDRKAGRIRHRLFSSFQAPVPPQSKGEAIFQDINLSSVSTCPRNLDPEAVFVVSGASRGIGLQFVKTLVSSTKVSSWNVCFLVTVYLVSTKIDIVLITTILASMTNSGKDHCML